MRGESGPNMRMLKITIAAGALVACSAISFGQKPSGVENALVGIKLFDTGLRVIQLYGTPDDVQAVGFGGSAIGPGGGGGRGPGAGGAPGAGKPTPAGGGAQPIDLSIGDEILFRQQSG